MKWKSFVVQCSNCSEGCRWSDRKLQGDQTGPYKQFDLGLYVCTVCLDSSVPIHRTFVIIKTFAISRI